MVQGVGSQRVVLQACGAEPNLSKNRLSEMAGGLTQEDLSGVINALNEDSFGTIESKPVTIVLPTRAAI